MEVPYIDKQFTILINYILRISKIVPKNSLIIKILIESNYYLIYPIHNQEISIRYELT